MYQEKFARSALVIFVTIAVVLSVTTLPLEDRNLGLNEKQSPFPIISNTAEPIISKGTQVNPYSNYQREPAPMGIADYGLGFNNYSYSYNASSFLGIISISSLSTYNSSKFVLGNMTFQLNLNLIFYNNAILYDYWVQDVVYLNTSNNQVLFLDNIWNISSRDSNMHNSSVSGNGTVTVAGNSLFYYDIASNNSRGNNITLTYPTTIYLKMNATRNSVGLPEVEFLYNDGLGWCTYDIVSFTFAKKSSAPYFLVDGKEYNPYGTYYDAELIMGGPGNSSQTNAMNLSVYLMLQYYNGNNYQSIQNAYDFGSDTGETIYNVAVYGPNSIVKGLAAVKVSTGISPLKDIYFSNQLSTLKVVTTMQKGSLFINGTNITEFSGGLMNVSLLPGTYSVELYNYTNGLFASLGNVTMKAGRDYDLSFNLYRVEFQEVGLPPGTSWYLTISGTEYGPINSSQYLVYLQNGSYNFTIYTTNRDYFAFSNPGYFLVKGSALSVAVVFSPVLFNITYIESGLPAGSRWTVTMNGKGTFASTNNTIVIPVTNGTYDYLISISGSYGPSNSTGAVSVMGSPVTVLVNFHIMDGYLSGTIEPSNALISINGTIYYATQGKYNISLLPGNYTVKITAPGYLPYSTNVLITPLKVTHVNTTSLVKRLDYATTAIFALIALFLTLLTFIWLRRRR